MPAKKGEAGIRKKGFSVARSKRAFGRAMGAAAVALAAFALAGYGEEGRAGNATVSMGGGATMGMVRIAPGTFTMGQNRGMPDWLPAPERQVTLTRGFYMSARLVTQDQFYAVMGANPSHFSGSPAPSETQGRRPVENVIWHHAIAFANRLSILQGLEPAYSIAGMSNADADAWLYGNVPASRNAAWDAATVNWAASGFRPRPSGSLRPARERRRSGALGTMRRALAITHGTAFDAAMGA